MYVYVYITMTKSYIQNFHEGTPEELHKKLLFGGNRYLWWKQIFVIKLINPCSFVL